MDDSFMKTGSDYYNKVLAHLREASYNGLSQNDGKAWDNCKIKAQKRYVPRGKVFDRMVALERTAWWTKMQADLDEILKKTKIDPTMYHPVL